VPTPDTCTGPDGKEVLCRSILTPENAPLFKPFDTGKNFDSEAGVPG